MAGCLLGKSGKKSGKIGKNQGKIGKRRRIGKKGQKLEEGSFTLPLLTYRAGYVGHRGCVTLKYTVALPGAALYMPIYLKITPPLWNAFKHSTEEV